jgi:hypothetical protein
VVRGLIVRVGATGAGALLALGLLAGPSAAKGSAKAHGAANAQASNKVTCFQPEGKTQGRSLSDPDGDTNGGADKPGCTGGVDPDDRDGNNGCGNDADREDDNNGNCGGGNGEVADDEPPQDEGPGDEPGLEEDGEDVTAGTETDGDDVTVEGAGLESESATPAAEAADTTPTDVAAVTALDDTTPAAQTTTPEPETQVLGETLTAPDTLPRTGAAVGGLALLGGLLVGGGRLTVLARRLLRIG